MKLSLADILVFLGLGMMATGLWMVRPWLALVVVGMLLFGAGIMGAKGGK